MPDTLTLDVTRPAALGSAERAVWDDFRDANPALVHPCFDWRFAVAADAAPGAGIAVFRRRGRIAGFFPFQRRGLLIQPLGAPMSDYHGVIAPAETPIGPHEAARLFGAGLRTGGWMSSTVDAPGFTALRRMACDVSGGRDAVEARLEADNHKFWKNVRRNGRALERDHGAAVFTPDDPDPAVLDWIIQVKRDQFRRTGRHDVFACGWTADLLRRLFDQRDGVYGLRVASLRTPAGDLIAAEASLDDGRTLHLWFPVYAEAYSKYGPGMLLVRLEIARAADEGYATVEFGTGGEAHKAYLAQPMGLVFEGYAAAPGLGRAISGAALAAAARGPASLRRFGTSLGRRLDIINACEVRPADWLAGTAAAAAALRKGQGATA